jgi:hypothetical protein
MRNAEWKAAEARVQNVILHSSVSILNWSATRDLHPEGSAILSRRGLLFPLKPVAGKWWA